MNKRYVVGLGEVLWDVLPEGKKLGGAPANFAYHAGQFYTKEILKESFQRCNILKINDEELVLIGRMFGYPGLDIENKCWLILGKYNLDMLVLTCGTNGSYVFTPGHLSFQETPKVKVADTVGAGDSFTGSFVGSILNGKSVPEAHRTAVQVSAYVCTQNGAMPTYPDELLK